MSSIIQLLPDHVANQIAAGEVVQRPASVVKELLENAVDARATDIKLIVKDAGKSLIQVIDNGIGMGVTDSRLCFERHATSKIRQAEDLFLLHTKGFRGEALASIAAIAHVEMKTRQEQDELGTHIVIEGSKFVSQEPTVLPKGTSFSVKNLFYNIPARRNFLKSDNVEMRHVVDEFQRVAMAHPNIYFTMYHNGSECFNLPNTNLRQRIVGIFAGKTNEKLIPLSEDTEIVVLEGFVGKPEFSKKNKAEQFFFVNDRYIKSPYLHHAIMSAYEGLLKDGMQPTYFLYLQVPPHTIDINIHPTKTEVKFDNESALYAILRAAVKHSLGQYNISPILDFERDPNLDMPYELLNSEAQYPTIEVDGNYNPFASNTEKAGGSKGISSKPLYREEKMPSWESLYVGLEQQKTEEHLMTFEKDSFTASFFEEEEEQSITKTYQIHKKYIVSPIKSGMVIIDQNRAHQRILYEQFLTNMTIAHASSQQLLFPIVLSYSKNEQEVLREIIPTLETTGFIFDQSNTENVQILGIPINTSEGEIMQVLDQLIADMSGEVLENSYSQNDTIAKSISKTMAIKTGTYLTEKEQESIVNNLFACRESNVSPFQKPTYITMRVEDIDKKFKI